MIGERKASRKCLINPFTCAPRVLYRLTYRAQTCPRPNIDIVARLFQACIDVIEVVHAVKRDSNMSQAKASAIGAWEKTALVSLPSR